MQAWLGKDHFEIVGKTGDEIPNLPSGYLFCPVCSRIAKLSGIQGNYWFGWCRFNNCNTRIIYRNTDEALAWVSNHVLTSLGMENRSFSVPYPIEGFPYIGG